MSGKVGLVFESIPDGSQELVPEQAQVVERDSPQFYGLVEVEDSLAGRMASQRECKDECENGKGKQGYRMETESRLRQGDDGTREGACQKQEVGVQ